MGRFRQFFFGHPNRGESPASGLDHYFLFSYLFLLVNTLGYLSHQPSMELRLTIFSVLLHLTYTFMYLLPAVVLTLGLYFILRRGRAAGAALSFRRMGVVYAVAVLALTVSHLLIYADKIIFNMFGYHLNGFVWNLVFTPGGLESLGGGSSTTLTYVLISLVILALQAALAVLCSRKKVVAYLDGLVTRRIYVLFYALFVIGSLSERSLYALSDIQSYSPVLATADNFPLYLRPSFRQFAKSIGMKVDKRRSHELTQRHSGLNYPLKPLVAESLRDDMLDPEIMPATWEFARRAHRFTQHYSGGNGTRMGMFTMFYGVHGSYWFSFLQEHREPVLFDVLKDQGYQFSMYTSAKFTYPEFDKTIFISIPKSRLHEAKEGEGWLSDRKNVKEMLDFISTRDKSAPFMTFMFFESPHARYYFPDECIIRRPYLEKMNYATMKIERDIGLIKNRYINSVHHLDTQIARILDLLKTEALLDDTIVIITGDHGEEFMEKGRWGHGSEFTEEQTRTPLVLWVPGAGDGVVDAMTSHLDIVPTVFPFLGVRNPPADYSLGVNLFGPEKRKSAVISDWSRVCYVNDRYKATFAVKARGIPRTPTTTKDDGPLGEAKEIAASQKEVLLNLMSECGRFLAK